MIQFNKYLDKHGFPKKPTPDNKISINYEKQIFLFSKLKRRFDLCFKLFSFNLIDQYYHDHVLDSFYYNNIRNIKLFGNFSLKLNLKLLSIFSYIIFKKNRIELKEDEVVLFGPYSHSHYHIVFEFFLRLVFLKNKKFEKTIWIPDNLKPYLKSKTYNKIFKNLKYKFFSTKENVVFKNCNYLTHVNGRWYIRKKIKKTSKEFTGLISKFRKYIFREHVFNKNKKFNYIIASRSKASQRRLINEKELLSKLRKYKFKKICLEDYSFEEQINIARNCKVMIGYHGGGLSNLFFMNSRSIIVEIFNKYYDHNLYNFLSKTVKVRYKSFECKKSFENLDGLCDIDKIENYIKKKI